MALATLFQDIGVNDAAEARAVIYKILNKKTSDLTTQQQGMLGTGIYRDISDELDILDAAGNPITRTSTVTLPSGEKIESKHSATPPPQERQPANVVQSSPTSASLRVGPGSGSYQDIFGEPWWDFFGPLYPDLSFIFSSECDDVYSETREVNSTTSTTINLFDLERGIYILKIQNGDSSITKKLILE